jgi:hypothetical protein
MLNKHIYIFILKFLLIANISYSQTLEWENKDVPDYVFDVLVENRYIDNNGASLHGANKSFLVFKTKEALFFDSNNENIKQPLKYSHSNLTGDEYLYILPIIAQPQKVILKFNNSDYKISFNQPMEEKSLPGLKASDVRYFEIESKLVLEYFNITENEKAKGNDAQPVGPNVSDALLLIKTFPIDIDLEITAEKDIISKINKSDKGYGVFVKTNQSGPANYVLNLFEPEFGNTKMNIYNVQGKELRYYMIKKPAILNESIERNITSVKDEFLSSLEGNWSGSYLNGIIYIEILEVNLLSNKAKGWIVKDNIKYGFDGFVKNTKEKGTYLVNINTNENNLVGSLANFSVDLIFKNNILNGYVIDKYRNAYDLVLLKGKMSTRIDHDFNLNKYKELFKDVVGRYIVPVNQQQIIKEINVEELAPNNSVFGYVLYQNNDVCEFVSKVIKNNTTYEFEIVLDKRCDIQNKSIAVSTMRDGPGSIIIQPYNKPRIKIDIQSKINEKPSYEELLPERFELISQYMANSIEESIQGRNSGEMKLDYELKYFKNGAKNFTYKVDYKEEDLKHAIENKLNTTSFLPPVLKGINIETIDKKEVNISWFSSKNKVSYNHNSTITGLSALSLPYGTYKTNLRTTTVNHTLFHQEQILKYKANGPLCAIHSLVIPGWGTRKVTYNKNKGWGRFSMVAAPLLIALSSEFVSKNNFNKYKESDRVNNIVLSNEYYNNANLYRRISLVSLGVGTSLYLFEFSWVITKGLQNLKAKNRVNEKIINSPNIYIRNENIKF